MGSSHALTKPVASIEILVEIKNSK